MLICLLLAITFAFTSLAYAQNNDVSKDAVRSPAAVELLENGVKKEELKTAVTESLATKILPSDVRVLIDVSGSMKKTDPQNLRKPAVDLIVRLLPDKSRAGIWTFGNDVNLLIPFKQIDADWRKQAVPKAVKINSNAMFTNIGKALDEVSFDKQSLSADYKTHIILLTDGVVDIGKDAVNNIKERQRIINDIFPSLQAAGYRVHTIALSPDADMDLLKKLSLATDGIFATANSAEQLMSVFLKIFDQAVSAERVPIDNNSFLMDASIKEFTALIFRKPGEDKTIIMAPDGKEYSATDFNEGVNWYRTDKYDLITVGAPKSGQWKIKTDIAPESRITVVSDLQLVVDPLKNNVYNHNAVAVTYSFQENGKTVTNKDFLGLIEAHAIISKMHTKENIAISLTQTVPSVDGFFHQSLYNFTSAGDYEIYIFVDGKTFKREYKHSISVRDNLMVLEKSNSLGNDGKPTYTYTLSTDDRVVDIKKTKISVNVKKPDNSYLDNPLTIIDGSRWKFSFSPVQEGDYTINIHALGELLDGSPFDEMVHADSFTYTMKKAQQVSSVAPSVKEDVKPTEIKTAEKSSHWLLFISIGVGNLLLIAFGVVAYKMMMSHKAKDELAEVETTLTTSTAKERGALDKTSAVKNSTKNTDIDLSDEGPAHIPMNADDPDILFPLDNMEDLNKPDDHK